MKNSKTSKGRDRRLEDLYSVGPATRGDFKLLGINSVEELALQSPDKLFHKLSIKTGKKQDICVLDTLRCAVEQARNPHLPPEQCCWWYWSRIRKGLKVPA